MPSNLKTANLDVELLGVIKFHERLSDALSDLTDNGYDYVILDCPPNLSMNTLNAFGASSVVAAFTGKRAMTEAPLPQTPPSQQIPALQQVAPSQNAPTPLPETPAVHQTPATQQAGGWMPYPHDISDRIMRHLDAYSQSVLHQLLRLSWGIRRMNA